MLSSMGLSMDARVPPDNVGYLIGDISRMIRTIYDRRVEPLGMTRSQWRAMIRLSRREGCSQTELANDLGIQKPTLGKLVERLEAKGWLERRPDPADARTRRLFLSASAAPILDEMHAQVDDVLEGIFDGLSREDAARLDATLMRIKDNLVGMLDDAASRESGPSSEEA